ncbi:MAG: YopX family protein [Bacteroidota bacterium]
MNREIKFRNWNKSFNQMTYFSIKDDARNFEFSSILMQFTGLKDKNGKESYEGDICKGLLPAGGFWGNIKVEKIGQVIYNQEMCRFQIEWKWSKNQHHIDLDCDSDFEIIGNIYEKPELIK